MKFNIQKFIKEYDLELIDNEVSIGNHNLSKEQTEAYFSIIMVEKERVMNYLKENS